MYLGYNSGSSGTYELSGGELSSGHQYIGHSGTGTFTQTGGTNTLKFYLYLGQYSGASGTYELSGGELSSWNQYIGCSGVGTFIQTGGTNTLAWSLDIGHSFGGSGAYELSGTGQLSANREYVGQNWQGAFTHDGGSNTVGYLLIGSHGQYNFSNGMLQVTAGLNLNGDLDLGGQSWSLDQEAFILNFAGGTVLDGKEAVVSLGTNSLAVVPAGFDPATVFKSYSNVGMTHTAGNTLVVPAGIGFGGSGEIDDYVQCAGTITANIGGFIDLNNGLSVTTGAEINLGSGTLTVEDDISGMSGGELSSGCQCIGRFGTGTFTQTGGTNTGSLLQLGCHSGFSGTYELSDGGLSSNDQYIGHYGTGTFIQTGGTNTIDRGLSLGCWSGSSGTYELSNGELSSLSQYIGHFGDTGAFTQTGGTNTLIHLYLGYISSSSGTYELSNGELSSLSQYIGRSGTGTFTQSSGTNTISEDLHLGWNPGSSGTYELSNGELSSGRQYIGYHGTGTFIQTGGTNTINYDLSLGLWSSSSGTYDISGGSLSVPNLYIGVNGSGVFNITDAAADITVSELLHFGPDSTFTAVEGGTIHMTGSAFEVESIDPHTLAGLENVALIFEGGMEDVDPMEIAGENRGAVMDGLVENFALGTLQLGGDAGVGQLQLVDNFDNQPSWEGDEALYVKNLILGAGSSLDLNGYDLFYLSFIDYGGTIYLNGGSLSAVPEPGTIALSAVLGLIGLLLYIRRRRSP